MRIEESQKNNKDKFTFKDTEKKEATFLVFKNQNAKDKEA